MTLQVSFDHFAETVKRLLSKPEAYVSPQGAGSLVTAANPERSMILAATTHLSPNLARDSLQESGIEAHDGAWLTAEALECEEQTRAHIAAVAYRSGDDRPGLWVDAFPALPTQITVLKAMFEEFIASGELADASFEEFMQLAAPNVVILSPEQVDAFLRQKENC